MIRAGPGKIMAPGELNHGAGKFCFGIFCTSFFLPELFLGVAAHFDYDPEWTNQKRVFEIQPINSGTSKIPLREKGRG